MLRLGRPCPTVANNIFVVMAMIPTGPQRRSDDDHNIILAQQPGAPAAGDLNRPVANDISMIEGQSGRPQSAEKARYDLRRSAAPLHLIVSV
jgi:hypothetical protein